MDLVEICNSLKKTRLKKNISLQEVSKQTKLHPSMLRNIEEVSGLDNVGKFYLKGFLKIYAQFLGQNNLLKDIDQAFVQDKQKKTKFAFRKEAQPPRVKKAEVRKPKVAEKVEETKPQEPKEETKAEALAAKFKKIDLKALTKKINKKTVYVILGLIAVLILVRLPGPKKVAQQELPTPKIQKVKKPTFVTPKTSKTEGPKPLASILTQGDVLVEIRADGKLIFQNIVIKGTKESWMADEKLEVKISNPSLVSLEIDNQIIPTSNIKRPTLYVVTSEGFRVEK